MTELLKRAEQLDRKKIQPNWKSSKVWNVKNHLTDFWTCEIEDRDLGLKIDLYGQDKEQLEEIRDKVMNGLLNK